MKAQTVAPKKRVLKDIMVRIPEELFPFYAERCVAVNRKGAAHVRHLIYQDLLNNGVITAEELRNLTQP